MFRVTVAPREDMLFHATAGEFEIDIDVPKMMGGQGRGPLPSEVLMWAMGTCVATLITRYFNNLGMDSSGIEVSVQCEKEGMKLKDFKVNILISDPEKRGHEENIAKLVKNGTISRSMAEFSGSEVDVIYPDDQNAT